MEVWGILLIKMNNLILERVKEGKCPICVKELPKDFDSSIVEIVDYNGQTVFVHKEHIKYEG